MKRIGAWIAAKWRAHPSARIGLLLTPLFAVVVWFGIGVVFPGPGDADDIKAALVNAGVFSVRVFAALFFVHMVTHPAAWAWDLPNEWRTKLQRLVVAGRPRQQFGAFVVLAGETFAKLWLLGQLLRALILWPQGVA